MEFTDIELEILYQMLQECIKGLNHTRHKNSQTMVAMHELKKIYNKIGKYKIEKENRK